MKKLEDSRVQRIHKLLEQGYSRAAVARIMRLDWWTVNDYANARKAAIDADRNKPVQEPTLDNPDAPP